VVVFSYDYCSFMELEVVVLFLCGADGVDFGFYDVRVLVRGEVLGGGDSGEPAVGREPAVAPLVLDPFVAVGVVSVGVAAVYFFEVVFGYFFEFVQVFC